MKKHSNLSFDAEDAIACVKEDCGPIEDIQVTPLGNVEVGVITPVFPRTFPGGKQ